MEIREDFLTFVPVHDVTGLGLANTLQNTLEKLGFDLNKLRGQGYDGAAAMRGSFRGVQAIIKEKYPKALYTHYVSHSLNLCLSDAAKIQDIRNAFGRTTILKNKILEIKLNVQATKLKSLGETRWVLRHKLVLLFKEFLEPFVAALEQLQTEGTHGTDLTRTNAVNISRYTYNLSQYLQKSNLDLATVLKQIETITLKFQKMRENCSAVFGDIYKEAKAIATLLNVEEKKP
ncbi:hypothetical protein AGLY_008563 [Aphis glycines]|uniref:DUF4371 domain-containing protein n=1 Tax=Aphis glycines TaxID=307491 RepID=A0A6G0TMM3_APHGL|nr:hypothetical protein AGLY_008563 [Aphis glycines]